MSSDASFCRRVETRFDRRRIAAGCLVALFPVQFAMAHDVWLSPSAGVAAVGDMVDVSLLIAEAEKTEVIGFDPARVDRLWVRSAAGEKAVMLPRPLAAFPLLLESEGTVSAGYQSKPAMSELDAVKFDAYLQEEHLAQVIEARMKTAPNAAPQREHYSRSLKALVRVGGAALVDCAIGLPLELTVVSADAAGVVVRATFEGQPLAGLWVDRADARGLVKEERATDAMGMVTFASWSGEWILRGTHMLPSVEADADWRSWWATTTFVWDGERIEACGK